MNELTAEILQELSAIRELIEQVTQALLKQNNVMVTSVWDPSIKNPDSVITVTDNTKATPFYYPREIKLRDLAPGEMLESADPSVLGSAITEAVPWEFPMVTNDLNSEG